MKFNIKKAAAIAVSAAVVCGISVNAVNAAESDSKTTKILCIGDSITDGYGTDGSYRKFLYHNLTESGYSIDMTGPNWSWGDASYTDEETGETFSYDAAHCGYSGYAIKEYSGRNGILETVQNGDYLTVYSPDVVILQIGTNDVIDNHELDKADERLETLVDYIVENISSESDLFVTTIPYLDPNRSDVYSWFSNYRHSSDWQTNYSDDEVEVNVKNAVDEYNSTVKKVVEKVQSEGVKNIHFADVNSAVTDVKTQLKDGVHPNNTGYKLMGNYWTSIMKQYLSGENPSETETAKPTETTSETLTETTEVTETKTSESTEISTEITETESIETSTEVTETESIETPTEVTETESAEPTETTEITETESTTETETLGDVNGDDIITVSDVVTLQKFILATEGVKISSYSDMNRDGKVNVIDLALLKYLVVNGTYEM